MISRTIFRELNFAPCADFHLLSKAYAAARARGTPVHVGGIYSSDTFYDERPDLSDQLLRHGCLGVEMETAELYILAARHKARAGEQRAGRIRGRSGAGRWAFFDRIRLARQQCLVGLRPVRRQQ